MSRIVRKTHVRGMFGNGGYGGFCRRRGQDVGAEEQDGCEERLVDLHDLG